MSKITQRSDGRYTTSITNPKTKKRIYFYGKTKKEVNQKVLAYNGEISKTPLFSEIADKWWSEAIEQIEYQTAKSYKHIKSDAIEEFGDKPISEIKTQDIDLYLKKLAKRNYAQKTVSNYKNVVNMIFKYAIIQNEIQFNPCEVITVPKGLPKEKRRSASPEDEKIIRETADIWIFPYFALTTGLRKGEIIALKWKDIDFENNCITVNKSSYYKSNKPIIKTPKTESGYRIVPLLNCLKEKIEKLKSDPEAYVISENGKDPLTSRQFQRRMKEYKQKTGITCTAHQLRHSFATDGFEAGLDPKTMQEIIGHKQLSTTMDIYTDFRKKAFERAAEILNKKQ